MSAWLFPRCHVLEFLGHRKCRSILYSKNEMRATQGTTALHLLFLHAKRADFWGGHVSHSTSVLSDLLILTSFRLFVL